ncbi:uncharacterized protein LOC128670667 isoform X2 [Plodia interpunctella]|uniref:uncharacterized protein LOC128670667 isoform X2 n=1 Tax=Plodia interpunctella TaxID=58824 RepID=UPI0023683C9D|nr:uncharacterized protein LOC128670667 isoform X2 [Plodia interpunctella]
MPLYSEHIANMYYGGSPTYTSGSYGYSGSSSLGTSYSAPYLNSGSNYSTHSSLGGYSRAPLTTRWITSSGRSYSPMLSTISERSTSSPVRINSPRRIPLMKRSYGTPTYTPRPININTADIDVSRDKYYHRRKSPSPVSPKTSPLRETIDKEPSPPKDAIDKDSGPFMPRIDGKPETGIDSSPGKQRSTIKRGRTVVRLHTIKRKDRDSPRKPTDDNVETDQDNATNPDDTNTQKTDSMKWRDKLADDLVYNDKREKKSLGTKLAEKFLVKEKDNDEVPPRKWETQQNVENVPTSEICEVKPSKFPDRRCSMELLAEQANLLDSLIKSENLSTATLDLTKIGVEEPHTSLDTYQSIKRRKSNPLKATKSDNSLHDSLKSFKDQKQLSKRRSLKKSLSGGSICRLDSITEMPKEPISANLPPIEEIEKRLSVKYVKSAQQKVKPKTIPKITSSVEVTAPVSPLKFKIENLTVEEIPRIPKKEITYSSTVIENDKINEIEPRIDTKDEKMFDFEPRQKSIKHKSIPSPEPEDGNFWDKIGKRETVYLLKRKQNLEETKEKQRRALFWFPEEEDDETNNDSDSVSKQQRSMTMSYKPQDKNDSIYQEYADVITVPKEIHKIHKLVTNTCSQPQTAQKSLNDEGLKENKEKNLLKSPADILPSINNTTDVSKEILAHQSVNANVAEGGNEENNSKPVPSTSTKADISIKNMSFEVLEKQEHKSDLATNTQSQNKVISQEVLNDQNNKALSIHNKTKESQYGSSGLEKSECPNKNNKIELDKTPPDIHKDAIGHRDEKSSKSNYIDIKTENIENKKENCLIKKKISQSDKKDGVTKKSSTNDKKSNSEKKDNSKKGREDTELKTKLSNENDITKSNNTDKIKLDNIPTQENIHNIEIKKAGEDNKAEANSETHTQKSIKSLKDQDSKHVEIECDKENKKDDVLSDTTIIEKVQEIKHDSEVKVQCNEQESGISTAQESLGVELKNDEDIKRPSPKDIIKLPTAPVVKRPVKDEPALRPLIATPRPLQKRTPQVIHSSSSSDTSSEEEDSSEEEEEEDSDSSEGSAEFFECETITDGRTSTGSNDSGFDSSAPTSPAGFVQIKKGADSPGPSTPPAKSDTSDISERELEQSTAYGIFRKTGRFTPPARSIPRFRKYTVEDFQFIKVLGKGSFGKVLLAELKDTEYYYAVKCLKKDVVLEDDDVECTLIERKVLALGTNHPYLCHLFATFQTDSHLFFVMEYLNGGDLMFHIQQSGRFPEARARFYAAEIVSGLKFLHKRGIVYRDLKLDNILLDFDGHVRIADFGMCKLQIYLDKTADTFCGTPDYMAPEIIKGLKYNQTVDWWSFGVLLYEMLIGQSPFSGCDEDELFWSICNEMPSYPRFLSQQALTILTRLLDKDAKSRLGGVECVHGDVREQTFFQPVAWERLERRELEAPFKPRVRHPLDTQYFDRAFTGERPRLTAVEPQVLRSMDQGPFRGFSYTNPNATDR